jgi:hypothetical protein
MPNTFPKAGLALCQNGSDHGLIARDLIIKPNEQQEFDDGAFQQTLFEELVGRPPGVFAPSAVQKPSFAQNPRERSPKHCKPTPQSRHLATQRCAKIFRR